MNSIETVLLENIDKPDSVFVFPTGISASRWADHALRCKGGTIAMNKFIAWDDFKSNSIRSKVKNKKSIPSALRKIFVSRLIKENAEAVSAGKTPVFTSIIKTELAQQSSQFTTWLTGILPQLDIWFKKSLGFPVENILEKNAHPSQAAQKAAQALKDDDKDMFTLVLRYAQFLCIYSLFEPAWETPPFNNGGKQVYIFFPESLSDYSEYDNLLSASSHVKTIRADGSENPASDAFYYTNSRSEITEAALYIRALHENKNIPWDSIAVCLGDPENYEPYLLREFTNRNIPFTKRTSKSLSDYPAGAFFRSVLDCVSQDFSFASAVSLIGNKNLPWKDEELIDKLLQFGMSNNCLYSWVEKKDNQEIRINVWEEAFKNPFGYGGNDIKIFFNNFKKRVFSLRCSESFAEIRRQYFIFREQFFDMEKCGEESDFVLSRCIKELMELAELEKSFPDVPAVDPFLFLTELLGEKDYLPQPKCSGVAILPYKTAAAVPFDCHIVLGAGQDNLSVINSKLGFLPNKKRDELGITDEDASCAFINMHRYNSIKISAFFCCEKSFSGFSIPHSKISSPLQPRDRYAEDPAHENKFSQDLYNTESQVCFSHDSTVKNNLRKLHENQITGFSVWKNRHAFSKETAALNKFDNKEIIKTINNGFAKTGKYNVSATSLKKYYHCSLNWLFESVYQIENTQIETTLMAENISGLVYHEILYNFFTELKESQLPEPVLSEAGLSLPEKYLKILEKSTDKVFSCLPLINSESYAQMSALTGKLLCAGKNDFLYHIKNSLAQFLSFFAGCTVIGSEYSREIIRKTYIMRGFVDCILKDNSEKMNKYIIVDFKLKHTPARADCIAEDGNSLSDFQLPMYITLTEEKENLKVYTALFYSIIDRRPEVIIGTVSDINTEKTIPGNENEIIIRGGEQYNIMFDEFKNRTEKFVQEISTGNFTVFAQNNHDCYNCNYQRICRTVNNIKRENIFLGKN